MAKQLDPGVPVSFTIEDLKKLRHWRPGTASFRVQLAVVMAAMVFVVAAAEGLVLGQSLVAAQQQRIGQSLQADAARIAEQLNKTMAARAN